jgi:hypothetical protein
VLNLYAAPGGRITMMTRDHIIPRSLGGSDAVQNLRPGCEDCNGARGNALGPAELEFMLANPHLVSEARLERGRRLARRREGESAV